MTECMLVPKALIDNLRQTKGIEIYHAADMILQSAKPVSAEPVAWRVSGESSYITEKEPFTHMVGSNRVVTPLYSAPQPEQSVSAEPVVLLEISNESYRFKAANQDALIALDDGEHWLYANPPKQEWVKCSEQKPAVGGRGGAIASDWVFVDYEFNGTNYTGEGKYIAAPKPCWKNIHGDTIRARHWMPLPQPPEYG